MDLEKVYYDSNGCSGNILQIVKREPEWAANRIQEGENLVTELKIRNEALFVKLENMDSKISEIIRRLKEVEHE